MTDGRWLLADGFGQLASYDLDSKIRDSRFKHSRFEDSRFKIQGFKHSKFKIQHIDL